MMLIPVGSTEIMIIITGRVVIDAIKDGLVYLTLNLVEIDGFIEFSFLCIRKAIETYIL